MFIGVGTREVYLSGIPLKSNKSLIHIDMKKESNVANQVETRKAYFPPYFNSRKSKMKKDFKDRLEESANSEVIESDKYGEYRAGIFLWRNCIVSVGYEDQCWNVHIHSESTVLEERFVKEIRYKFVPDRCMMVKVYQSREVKTPDNVVVLMEAPVTKDEDIENDVHRD